MNWGRRKLNSATYGYRVNCWRWHPDWAIDRVSEGCGPLLEKLGDAPPDRDA